MNLATSVRQALEGLPVATTVHCWLDSSVALHWIGDRREYRQFVANRVRKIQTYPNVVLYHVPSTDNPADLESRGGSVIGAQLWLNGPTWLADPSQWPPEIVTEPSPGIPQRGRLSKDFSQLESREVMTSISFSKALACAMPLGLVLGSRDSCTVLVTLPTKSRELCT